MTSPSGWILCPISIISRKLSAEALRRLWEEKEIGVAHHQVDIFLLDATSRYFGRLCRFNRCPKHKPECRVRGCGDIPFLRQHDGFRFDTGVATVRTASSSCSSDTE